MSLLSQWSQNERLLRIHTPIGTNKLLVESFKGIEDLHQGFTYAITLLSTNANIPFDSLLGQPVLLEMLTIHNRYELRPFHGYVTHIQNVGANGGFARYHMVVEPWTAFMAYRVDSTSYQDMTVMQILDSVFADYQAGAGLNSGQLVPKWRFELADSSAYAKRSLTTQYQESDLAFVQRLMAEEGLFSWIEHTGDISSPSFGEHTLVIADHNDAFLANQQADIRFTQPGATISEDSLDRWRHEVYWQSNAVTQRSWDYRQNNTRPISAMDNQNQLDAPSLSLEETPVSYAYQNSDQGQRLADRQLEALVAHSQHYTGAGTVRTLSPGTTFTLHDHASTSSKTPLVITRVVHQAYNNLNADLQKEIAQHLGLAVDETDEDAIDLNISRHVYQPQSIQTLQKTLNANEQAGERPLYRNRITAIPHDIAYRNRIMDAQGLPIHPKPKVNGQQTAIVVGPAGAVVHTDRDHRVKVQFHWQRGDQSHSRLQHPITDGHTGAPANEQAGTWVRVMTNLAPIAGSNWGSVQVPRIGQEVLIDFTEGDIDRPIVIGALYNGEGNQNDQHNQRAQGTGAATGNASAWFPGDSGAHAHADVLSGIKTQALSTSQQGTGSYNQLVFDDTPNESRTSLQQYHNMQSVSQLNLGFLRHQTDNQRLNATGYGSELTTHHNLAVRAGQGLLISTDKRANIAGSQMDSREASVQIEQSLQLQQNLAKTAQAHHAKLKQEPKPDKINAIAAQEETLDTITNTAEGNRSSDDTGGTGTVTAYSKPNIQLSSPAGIIATTAKNAIFNAGVTSSITTGQDINLSTQGNQHHLVRNGISLFTYGKTDPTQSGLHPNKPNTETGIKLHTASGKISLQSQSGATHAKAEQNITVNSTTDKINIAAPNKHLLMTAQGAYIKLAGGNIMLHGPGNIDFKAAKKNLAGPKSLNQSLTLAKGEIKGCAQQQVQGLDAITEF